MIQFVLLVPDPDVPEDRWLTKTISRAVLPRTGEMIYLPGCIGRNVEQVRHDYSEENVDLPIEVVVGVVEEEFLALHEEFGWEKHGFD